MAPRSQPTSILKLGLTFQFLKRYYYCLFYFEYLLFFQHWIVNVHDEYDSPRNYAADQHKIRSHGCKYHETMERRVGNATSKSYGKFSYFVNFSSAASLKITRTSLGLPPGRSCSASSKPRRTSNGWRGTSSTSSGGSKPSMLSSVSHYEGPLFLLQHFPTLPRFFYLLQ